MVTSVKQYDLKAWSQTLLHIKCFKKKKKTTFITDAEQETGGEKSDLDVGALGRKQNAKINRE